MTPSSGIDGRFQEETNCEPEMMYLYFLDSTVNKTADTRTINKYIHRTYIVNIYYTLWKTWLFKSKVL
jgi:hypothetical protein